MTAVRRQISRVHSFARQDSFEGKQTKKKAVRFAGDSPTKPSVRFCPDDQVVITEIPSLEDIPVKQQLKLWWSKAELDELCLEWVSTVVLVEEGEEVGDDSVLLCARGLEERTEDGKNRSNLVRSRARKAVLNEKKKDAKSIEAAYWPETVESVKEALQRGQADAKYAWKNRLKRRKPKYERRQEAKVLDETECPDETECTYFEETTITEATTSTVFEEDYEEADMNSGLGYETKEKQQLRRGSCPGGFSFHFPIERTNSKARLPKSTAPRSVCFSDTVTTLPTPIVSSLSKDRERRWMTEQEELELEFAYGEVLDRMEAGDTSDLDTRGLEDRTYDAAWAFYERVRDAVTVVLLEQLKQRRCDGEVDPVKIAHVYQAATRSSGVQARSKGEWDAWEARKYRLRRRRRRMSA